MTTPITAAAARELGIAEHHERMANGEHRFRLMAGDGSGYIRTEATETGAWQNSHYHHHVVETFIVQRGWIAVAELVGDAVDWRILQPENVHTTRPDVPHNIYMSANSVLHTVKHGNTTASADWFACAALDELTKHLTEPDIQRAAR